MSLEGKRLIIIDSYDSSSAGYTRRLAEIAQHFFKAGPVYKCPQFPMPSLQTVMEHDAALIHMPRNTQEQQLYLQLLLHLLEKNFPFVVIIALLSDSDFKLVDQLQQKNIMVFEKKEMRRMLQALSDIAAI